MAAEKVKVYTPKPSKKIRHADLWASLKKEIQALEAKTVNK